MTRKIFNALTFIVVLNMMICGVVGKMNFVINNNLWNCIGIPVEGNTVLDIDYHIEGVNREEIRFEAR